MVKIGGARRADLHTHTVFSDGTCTPEALVRLAADLGLAAIAVSDHDSVAGIPDAMTEADKVGIEVIPAVELSAELADQEIHILGYCIDHTAACLRQALTELVANRVERIHTMVGKLRLMGIELSAQDVFAVAEKGPPGRMHIAQALLNAGYITSLSEAFAKYIGDTSPAYVCGFRLSPQKAITLLRDSGGVAVLAHPYLIKNDSLIPELVTHGLAGLEVYYPEHTQAMTNFYRELASRYDLIATGGSDFHGRVKPNTPLGSVTVDYDVVDALKLRRP
jgi:hypothetical protein